MKTTEGKVRAQMISVHQVFTDSHKVTIQQLLIFYGSFVQQLLCASIDRHTHSVYRNSRKVL